MAEKTHWGFGVVARVRDEDTLTCLERDGTPAAKGRWYEDRTLSWLNGDRRARFTVERTGKNDVTVRRV